MYSPTRRICALGTCTFVFAIVLFPESMRWCGSNACGRFHHCCTLQSNNGMCREQLRALHDHPRITMINEPRTLLIVHYSLLEPRSVRVETAAVNSTCSRKLIDAPRRWLSDSLSFSSPSSNRGARCQLLLDQWCATRVRYAKTVYGVAILSHVVHEL